MIERLVVNGCSYMDAYVSGGGHIDLAKKLNISTYQSLAQSGCNNNRILRSTLKDSYHTDLKTFYVLGITFINRSELPILYDSDVENSFEGRWSNPQNQAYKHKWDKHWDKNWTKKFVEVIERGTWTGILDLTEDLMYRMLAAKSDLESRNHKVLFYQQADDSYLEFLNYPKLKLFQNKNFVNGFKWRSIPWQHFNEVPAMSSDKIYKTPEQMKHREPGCHDVLNTFLTNYIKEYKILE